MTANAIGPSAERRAADRVTAATILLVDDSTAVRRILRRALEGTGYQVEEAADGEQAIAACRMVSPDLVLLDVDMPVMDGIAALAAMRADDVLRSIPVVFLTARTGGADVARGLDLGAQDYLRKPCDPVELVARVASTLRLSDREHALDRRAREATQASATDPLTGLGNRRVLTELTDRLLVEVGAHANVGVIVIDVDHFKRINDEHGHQTGDAVLRILSRRLEGALGADATLVRWGGEEFLAVVPGCTPARLTALGEELRIAIGDSPIAVDADVVLPVTVSVGCAVGTLAEFDASVKAADDALFCAKRTGRNRVVGPSIHNRKS